LQLWILRVIASVSSDPVQTVSGVGGWLHLHEQVTFSGRGSFLDRPLPPSLYRSELGALEAMVSGALVAYGPCSTSIPSSSSRCQCFMVSCFGISTILMPAFVHIPSDQRGEQSLL
jgi:hypothetical protein